MEKHILCELHSSQIHYKDNSTKAHWKNVPVATFLQNYITFRSTFKTKCPVNKAKTKQMNVTLTFY